MYNNKNYAKKKKKADLLEVDTDNTILNQFENKEALNVKVEFLSFYIAHVDKNLSRYFKKEDERKVADAVLTVFKSKENLDSNFKYLLCSSGVFKDSISSSVSSNFKSFSACACISSKFIIYLLYHKMIEKSRKLNYFVEFITHCHCAF